jgi:hypothetical protein
MSDAQQPPVAYQPGPPNNVPAIIALIASCLGFTVPGIVLGHIALHQIRRTGEAGHGLAAAALIVGYILFGVSILLVAGYVIVFIALAASGSTQLQNFG